MKNIYTLLFYRPETTGNYNRGTDSYPGLLEYYVFDDFIEAESFAMKHWAKLYDEEQRCRDIDYSTELTIMINGIPYGRPDEFEGDYRNSDDGSNDTAMESLAKAMMERILEGSIGEKERLRKEEEDRKLQEEKLRRAKEEMFREKREREQYELLKKKYESQG